MITQSLIEEVEVRSKDFDDTEKFVAALREVHPKLHITYCMDDDVCGPKPIRELAHTNIYLVNAGETCVSFTPSLENATGLVLAEVIDDDE